MSGGIRPIVLVADDDAALRTLCRVNLELDGFEVREAESAVDVVRELADEAVSLVLLDVRLGADDGIALATKLRGHYPTLPIAFFTGSVSGPVGEGVVDGILSKPFTLEELADVARRLASGRAFRSS